jgi:hypothetical protein
VPPGTEVRLETEIKALRDEMAAVKVRARVGRRVHAQAEQIFVFNALPLADPGASEDLEAIERSELVRLWPDYPGDF